MLYIGSAVLLAYLFLDRLDDARRRLTRAPGKRETRIRLLNVALHAALFGFLCVVPPYSWCWPFFAALVAMIVATRLWADSDREAVVSGGERFRHGLLQIVQAPVWILVAAIWEFIDGAGFIVGLVLPVSTRNLRPLCQSCAAVWTVIFLIQAALAWRSRRRAHTAEVVPAPVELPKAS